MSNERRVAKSRRRWLVEGLDDDERVRTITAVATSSRGPLVADSRPRLIDALRQVAGVLIEERESHSHCEWVWNGRRLWIVQADEIEVIREKGLSIHLVDNRTPPPSLHVLKRFSHPEVAAWRKLERPRLFDRLGLPTADVYVLSGSDWNAERHSPILRMEFQALCELPVVVRCDVRGRAEEDTLLLPTSQPATKVDDLYAFMASNAAQFRADGLADEDWAFLVARLVPANASAMIQAFPAGEWVRVDALWGFPDGLLHYAHDSYLVDTPNGRFTAAVRYKGSCLHYRDGAWQEQFVGPPEDWEQVLSEDETQTLSQWARQIADALGREVQLMVLCRIGGRRGAGACLPWHYTDLAVPSRKGAISHIPSARRILALQDWQDLQKAERDSDAGLQGFRIRPRGSLLRDTGFLKAAGALAVKRRIPIYFAGSLLGHAYYVLAGTGATVVPIAASELLGEPKRYDKLVRDRIPAIVRRAGGLARVRRLSRSEATLLLKMKLVEEAFEAWNADGAVIASELADIAEVIDALCVQLGLSRERLEEIQADKRSSRGGFEDLLYLEETIPGSMDFADDPSAELPLFMADDQKGLPVRGAVEAGTMRVDSDGDILRLSISLVPPIRHSTAANRLVASAESVDTEATYRGATLDIVIRPKQAHVDAAQLPLFPPGEES